MPEQFLFIGRDGEMSLIEECIKAHGSSFIIAISAEGGIGKSRLLREVRDRYAAKKIKGLSIADIIDFDDLAFRIPRNVTRRISEMLERKTFEPYLIAEIEYRDMQIRSYARERLEEEKKRVSQKFIQCFNSLSTNERIVLFFDTTDKLDGKQDVWLDLEAKFKKMNNFTVLIAGRDAKQIVSSFKIDSKSQSIEYIGLEDFPPSDSRIYIQQRCKQKNISNIEFDFVEKIIFLTGGRPVLLDLAVEWRTRGISLDWLEKSSLEDLDKLKKTQLKKKRLQVEKQLVSHITDLQELKHRLILLLSHVYPLNVEMIKILLKTKNAKKLFNDAKDFVFVKTLPNDFITLHDVMRDMVNDYVWREVHPDRRNWYSQKALEIYRQEIADLNRQIEFFDQGLKSVEKEKAFEAALKRVELEQQLWVLKEEFLRHSLIIDTNQGVETFIETFEDATKKARLALRKRFIDLLDKQIDKLSESQICVLEYYKTRQIYGEEKFKETQKKCEKLLANKELLAKEKVDTLILKGNAEIRLGAVGESLKDFEKAVTLCEENNLAIEEIKAKNALGWAYRLTGDLEQAQKYYSEARNQCLHQGGPNRKELSEVYGLILNNYAFVLSNENHTRKAAIDMANTAISHWIKTGDNIGLGAGYLVLGIAYYRSDVVDLAMDAFQKALDIFEPLGNNDWIGQIYSWRGAQYHDIQEFDLAKRDFEASLRIGATNIKAMTLNRLARVYMNRHDWIKAEQLMMDSLRLAREIPDYTYWLGSIARLISISAKKYLKNKRKIAEEFDKFSHEVDYFKNNFQNPEKNTLGIVYLGLAKLLFLLNDRQKIDAIINYLKLGIPFIVEHGSFARTDILTRLAIIEEDFDRTDPKIIHQVGNEMQNHIYEIEAGYLNYSTAVEILFNWANWN